MSSRERFLVILLAAVVILLGGFKLLVEPEIGRLGKAMADNAAANADWVAAQNSGTMADSLSSENDKLKTRASDAAAAFFPELEHDNLQVFFRDIAQKSGVTIQVYNVSGPIPSQIGVVLSQDSDITYPAKEAAAGILDEKRAGKKPVNPGAGKGGSAADVVEMATVSLQFTSGYQQMLDFLKALRDSGRVLRVSSLTVSGAGGGSVHTGVTVECYGVKKLSADSFSDDTLGIPAGKANPFS